MKKLLSVFFILALSLGAMFCTSSKKLDFYRGASVRPIYISVTTDFTPEEIGFRVEMYGRPDYLYHIVLNEDGERISEGWFRTRAVDTRAYVVSMKAKEGFSFEQGKVYHLCVGQKHPDIVEYGKSHYRTNNYPCTIYWEFTLPKVGERR